MNIGLPPQISKLLHSYLSDRKITVKVGNSLSETFTPLAGVPQGSVLAPLLYLIYTHDIPPPNHPTSKCLLYADDTALISVAKNSNQLNIRTQNLLNRYSHWCSRWRVSLNPQKTQFIVFKHPNSKRTSQNPQLVNVNLLGVRLAQQTEVDYLGVRFSRTLNWSSDVQRTLDKMRKRASLLGALCGRIGRCNPDTLIHTYNSFIRPVAEYRAIPYGVLPTHLSHKLTTLERRILRRCQYLPYRSPSGEVFLNTPNTPILTRFQSLRKQYVSRTLKGTNTHSQNTLRTPWRPNQLPLFRRPKRKLPQPNLKLLTDAQDLPLTAELQDLLESAPLSIR